MVSALAGRQGAAPLLLEQILTRTDGVPRFSRIYQAGPSPAFRSILEQQGKLTEEHTKALAPVNNALH